MKYIQALGITLVILASVVVGQYMGSGHLTPERVTFGLAFIDTNTAYDNPYDY